MALSTPYCTVQDVADELKNNDGLSGDPDYSSEVAARWERSINRASRMAEEFCHRDWTIHDHSTDMLTVEDKYVCHDEIILPYPIKSISEIYIDGELEDSDGYRKKGRYSIERSIRWPKFPFDNDNFIQIKGVFGYTHDDLTTVPNDEYFPEGLRRAVALLAAVLTGDYRKEIMDREGGATELLITDIPKEVKMLLRKYRRRFF